MKILFDVDTLLNEIIDRYEFYSASADPDSAFIAAALLYVADVIRDKSVMRMTNRQWVDFLSVQFDISRTSAKEMLHGMMRWKKTDTFKKMFNGGTK